MLKILKQELLFFPLMFVLMEGLRNLLVHFYPDTALFDRGSEVESFFFRVWQIVWITCASWLLLRVVFPSPYKAFKRWYHGFSLMEEIEQRNLSVKLFFAFFFGLVLLLSGRASNEQAMRTKLMDTLNSQLYVREATGKNDGVEVEKYLSFVGRQKGDAWCAAFASWNLNAIGVSTPPNPKSGWSPNFANKTYVVWSAALNKQHKAKKPQKGDCFTLYYSNLGRVGHVGFIVDETPDYFITIEGNTGLTGSREGSGVHKYKRAKSKVYAITNYITPYITKYEKPNINAVTTNSIGIVPNKANTINRNNFQNGQYNNIGLLPRFYFCSGFNSLNKGRQFERNSSISCRYNWKDTTNRNCERFAKVKLDSVSKGWSALCQLPLQGYRIKTINPRALHKTLFNSKQKQGICSTKNHFKNRSSKIYTQVAYMA